MKGKDEVIGEFNELVNMTPSELEEWLKSDDSNSAGWPKDSGDGESVGHDSGRKIVDILQANPQKKPEKYTDKQIEHMRKVVSYCKRHLAQESAANEDKPTEDIKKTKSYASLKNWGHDILKKRTGKSSDSGEAEAGDKRSRQDGPTGDNKVRKTKKSSTANNEHGLKDEDIDDGEEQDQEEETEVDDGEENVRDANNRKHGQDRKTRSKTNGRNGAKNSNGENSIHGDGKNTEQKEQPSAKSTKDEPEPGDTVSWKWGQGQPEGKVLEVKHKKASVITKRGNEVSRSGSDKDPAVILDTGKSKAIKLSHELN